ncbi:MAG: type 1 glutamine amidotransferase [Comamonas sp.]|jgi:GMP synthase-like glutamine amidotransferase|uniref:type 1 glutamine amidotransferase n=1 Tax=Comamonas sp. TaxID=34028 RepID=UPI0028496132|nr:type 1 glutamine amidotransferase [Comamonas sp.]MDR3065044.1 type 1 glutamine amidotransferase [Comamonas sp.]
MKPVVILQHEASQGPGILLDHLRQQAIDHVLIDPCAEGAAPANARDYRGIIVLGSNHCANEQLHWIDEERCLLQSAVRHDIPVLGHCFGAQMLARALGAAVWRNPWPNIGWSEVRITPCAQKLMDLPAQATIFNWHYDSFDIPASARRTMIGKHCLNKGFVHGRQWAFQGHLEVTADSVRRWCGDGHDELLQARGPAVQSEAQILERLPRYIDQLHAMALRTYKAWTDQLDKPISISCSSTSATLKRFRLKSDQYLHMQL